MVSAVKLRGGFVGTETSADQASPATNITILSGDLGTTGQCDVVLVCEDTGADTLVSGFRVTKSIKHGIVINATPGQSCEPTLDLLDITDNGDASTSFGGGIAVTGGASPVISQCVIHGNFARFGGGIAIDSVSRASITRCTIYSNTAGYPTVGHRAGGGGIYSDSNTSGHGPTIVRSCFIHDNFVTFGDGGGIMTTSVIRVLDVLLEKNIVSGGNSLGGGNGAGLAAVPANTNSPAPMVTLHNVDFYDNACQSPALDSQAERAGGGGAFVLKGRLQAVNCLFRGNDSAHDDAGSVGGALLCDNNVTTTVTNLTVEGNKAYTFAGVFVQDGNTNSHLVRNSIFWHNVPIGAPPTQLADANLVEVNSNTVTNQLAVDYCDIGDQTAGDAMVPFGGAAHHNIDLNPLFVGSGNHRLQACSPCIDAADSALIPQDAEDLNGDGRTTCNDCGGDDGERQPDLDLRVRTAVGILNHGGVAESTCRGKCGSIADMGAFEFQRKGDLNFDGRVDGDDIQWFENCLFGVNTNGVNCLAGDLNGNTVIDADDAACMVETLLFGVSHCDGCIAFDCNTNSVPDVIDLARGTSNDCNTNSIPDECDNDCNTNGWADECDDCNTNGTYDSVDIANNPAIDANSNGIPDECEETDSLTGGGESQMSSQGWSESNESESGGNSSNGLYRQSPENTAAINALLAWFAENPREDYPHLTDAAYADFVLDQAECLGLYSP